MAILIVCIGSYFVGATNFAVIFYRLFKLQDMRKVGGGNAGATNMFRVYGLALGLLTFVCDLLKGVVCILLSKCLFFNSFYSEALTRFPLWRKWAARGDVARLLTGIEKKRQEL